MDFGSGVDFNGGAGIERLRQVWAARRGAIRPSLPGLILSRTNFLSIRFAKVNSPANSST